MTAFIHIHDPDHGCRDCGNTGTIRDEHTHIYGAFKMVRCHCVPPVIDTAPARPSSAQLLDEAMEAEWAADPETMSREYWDRWHAGDYFNAALVIGGAVLAGAAWVAADLVFSRVVGVV